MYNASVQTLHKLQFAQPLHISKKVNSTRKCGPQLGKDDDSGVWYTQLLRHESKVNNITYITHFSVLLK